MAPPADRDFGDLPAILAGDARELLAAIRTTGCWRGARGSASTRRSSATSRWRRAACCTRGSAARASFPPLPISSSCRRPATAPRFGRKKKARTAIAARLYTFRFRSVPYPALQTFDAPNGDFSCVRRARSNTPLQALTSLNEPLFLECARALALSTVWQGGSRQPATTDLRLPPLPVPQAVRATKRAALLALYDKETRHFASDEPSALAFAANNVKHPSALPAGTTVDELAGWTAVSRVLLNLDETITKE